MFGKFCRRVVLSLAACGLIACGHAADFTASLDRDTITLGESATLTLRFDGALPQTEPALPKVAGLNYGNPVQNRISMNINGTPSSILTLSYTVTPEREGEYTIPALTADVNGQRLFTSSLKLVATKASAPTAAAVNSGNEVAFLKLSFPKPKIYVGETAVGQLELYLRDDVQNFGNFQMTSSPADGFNAGKLVELQNQRRRAQIGNRIYTIIPIGIPLTAIRAGALTLGPFTASAVVVLPSQNGGDAFFQQFFNQGQQKQVMLATDPVSMECLALPEPNKPANFAGAVGDFTMAATVGPTNVTVGDPITARVQISGRGALDSVVLPEQGWQNFKAYPPTAKLETTDQFGFQGTKTFEQIISPLNSDVHELPALTFSFFNPEDGQYHTLTQPAVPLVVRPAGATPMPALAAAKNAAPENQSPQDIVPIKEDLGALSQISTPLVARPAFLAVQSLPVLAFLGAFVWRRRTDSLANNPRLRRQRAVAALIASGMDDLKKYAAANQPDEFFATLFRLLQEQLGERLDCPASAITENVVDEHPVLRSSPSATRDALREQFQLCNQARYALVRGTSELNSVAGQFEKLISQLREVKA